jgi:hypothetical protein
MAQNPPEMQKWSLLTIFFFFNLAQKFYCGLPELSLYAFSIRKCIFSQITAKNEKIQKGPLFGSTPMSKTLP